MTTNTRDQHIANLVKNFKMAIVDAKDIPTETHVEDEPETFLLETTGRPIIKKTNYFSFVMGKQQFTAPATIVERLRRVEVEYADDTNNLVVRTVCVVDDFADLVESDELNDEMYHWGHQVYMVKHNDIDGYNTLIHVSRYNDNGKWETRNYIAQVVFP